MVDGVVAVLVMQAALPEDVLGDEENPQALKRLCGNARDSAWAEIGGRTIHAWAIAQGDDTIVKSDVTGLSRWGGRKSVPVREAAISSPAFLSLMLTAGGDQRIRVPRGGNTNVYGASPYPRSTLGYAASTANDISQDAFHHVERIVARWPAGGLQDHHAYRQALEAVRIRMRAALGLADDIDIVFAPSGTDLEYVALALAAAHSGQPITNILLGQDEVGSGCALAAAGRHFANETAVRTQCVRGSSIAGFGDVELASLAVRDAGGQPLSSGALVASIGNVARNASIAGRHALVHVVHGSKTGLVLPDLGGIDRLRDSFGTRMSFVVDACQARLEPWQLREYLDRQAVVLLTGSKFVGGPPFSGFALVPRCLRPERALAAGLADVFRRGEWPLEWTGCDHLPGEANAGLLLRIEAALFELERYLALAGADRARVIARFGRAVRLLADRLGVALVSPSLEGDVVHRSTLATLDLSSLPARPDLIVAQRWCRVLAARGLRLGQPVKCQRMADGGWAGTLRVSLSMPMITSLSDLDCAALDSRFDRDMAQIGDVLQAAQRPFVA